MRTTQHARAAGRSERSSIGTLRSVDELLGHVIAELDRLSIDVIAVGHAQMEGSRAVVNAESGVVTYDETLPVTEVLEVLAHELGHMRLHGRLSDSALPADPLMASAFGDTGPTAIARYSPKVREEAEANAFASEFTCPSDLVFGAWQKTPGIEITDLAAMFAVAPQVVRVQLANALHDVAIGTEPGAARESRAVTIALTEEQRRAARFSGRPALVDAGAGTGKTATLIGRVEFLLGEKGARPEQILVLTFSNEAAQELVERITDSFGVDRAKGMTISTFHGLGMEFLHLHGGLLGFDEDPRLLDEDAQAELIYEILGRVPCPEVLVMRDPWETASKVLEHINHCKHHLVTPEALATAQKQAGAGVAGDEVVSIYREYERVKGQTGRVDFADLIMLPLQLLTSNAEVRNAWQAKFPWVMVDEFQDVSRATSRLLRGLCGAQNPPWVVGDARQSIYRFLGASPENVSDFRADFPDAEIFSLEVNYRSSDPIVAAANELARLMVASPGTGVSSRPNWRRGSEIQPLGTEAVAMAEATSDYAERAGVVAQIRNWIERDGVAPGDVAVLARRHIDVRNTMLGLRDAGIKAQAAGLLTAEGAAGDLAAVLTLGDAPRASIGRLAYALGRDSATRAEINTLVQSMLADDQVDGSLAAEIAAVAATAEEERFSGDAWVALTSFLFQSSAYLRRVLAAPDTAERAMTLIEIVSSLSLAAAYRATHPAVQPRKARIGFAERLRVRLTETVPLPLMPKPRADTVRVMTCHASKGLEFPCVIVAGQTVPKMPERYPWLPIALRQGANEDDEQANSLLFVGVTRAKRAVVVSWPTHAGQSAQARRKKLVPLLEAWRGLDRVSVRTWEATGAVGATVGAGPVWGYPSRGVLKASALTEGSCPLLTYMETILGIRFPEEEQAMYPLFFGAVRRVLRRVAMVANEMRRQTSGSEVRVILDEEWPEGRYSDHPHANLYRATALDIAVGFASAFAPGAVGSVMLEPELATMGQGTGPKVILDLVAYFREPSGQIVTVAFRPESFAAKVKDGTLLWSNLAKNKRISFVLVEANVGSSMPQLYAGQDRAAYAFQWSRKKDSLTNEAEELAARYRALAGGDFTTDVDPYSCDGCRARVSCPYWIGALEPESSSRYQ
jgi:DNA helicase II / ATP-dependent DNA helicase PcrA